MKRFLPLLFLFTSVFSFGQFTYVPDDNLEASIEDQWDSFDWATYGGSPNDDYVATAWFNINYSFSINGSIYPVVDWTGMSLGSPSQLFLTGFPSGVLDLSQISQSGFYIANCLSTEIIIGNVAQLFVENNPLLENIIISGNLSGPIEVGFNSSLQSLDMGNGTVLNSVDMLIHYNNSLSTMNLKNGGCIMWSGVLLEYNPSLFCVNVDDPNYCDIASTWMWREYDNWDVLNPGVPNPYSYSTSCVVGIEEYSNQPKKLIRIIDYLGRETTFKPNTPLVYQYDDGSVEKVMEVW